jgi:hypothetical protein
MSISGDSRAIWTTLDDSGRVWTARRVLHNRRVQVRFLSHLPLSAEFMRMAGAMALAQYVCFALDSTPT